MRHNARQSDNNKNVNALIVGELALLTAQYHVVQIRKSENWNSYSIWKLNDKPQ